MIDSSLVTIPMTAISASGDALTLAVMQKALVERVNAARAELNQLLNEGWDIKAMTSGAQHDGTYLYILLTKNETEKPDLTVQSSIDNLISQFSRDSIQPILHPVADKGD